MRAGELRAEDYARALLDRAASCKGLNAFLALEPAQVLEAARGGRPGAAAGRDPRAARPPDSREGQLDTLALPTTPGTRALAGSAHARTRHC